MHRFRRRDVCHARVAIGVDRLVIDLWDVGVDFVRAVLGDELGEVLDGAGAGVVDGGVLLAGGVEFDGGEAGDFVGDVVEGRVDFGDGHFGLVVWVGLVERGEFFVFGGEAKGGGLVWGWEMEGRGARSRVLGRGEGDSRFAVAAPRGVEFDQDVLLVVEDDVVVVERHDHGDGAFLFLRDRLRFDAGRKFPRDEVLDEGADILLRQLGSFKGVFLVLVDLLDGEGWPFVGWEVEVAGVGAKGFRVDGSEVDFSLVCFCDRFEGDCELRAFFGGFGENVC